MKASINIGGKDDPFYRYKMPTLETKVEGSGKMIKTFVANLDQLSNSLKRDAEVILKYLGYARSVNVNLSQRYMSGSHSKQDLSNQLNNFVKTFVLCEQCELPEAAFVQSTKKLSMRCGSCGFNGAVNVLPHDVPGTKTLDFILKRTSNKACKEDDASKKKSKRDKKEKGSKESKRERGSVKDKEEDSSVSVDESGSSTTSSATTSATLVSQMQDLDIASCGIQLATATATGAMAASEMADQALLEAARAADEAGELNEDNDGADDAHGDDEFCSKAVRSLHKFICSYSGDGVEQKIVDIVAELRSEQIINSLDANERLAVLVRSMFDENILQQLSLPFSIALMQEVFKAQAAQDSLMNVFVQLTVLIPSLTAQIPQILKELYDNDILSEEVALSWDATLPSIKLVTEEQQRLFQAHAKPFLDWLREAEEEEDGDD